jgi:hypothetical protein
MGVRNTVFGSSLEKRCFRKLSGGIRDITRFARTLIMNKLPESLVDIAYTCLTRPALDNQDEQGCCQCQKALRLPPISPLKAQTSQMAWREAIQDVVQNSHEEPVLRRLEKLPATSNRSV